MARVTGPLMSMEASGSIGKALTFGTWVGRAYVRRWAAPANPQTAEQMDGRNRFSIVGRGAAWAAQNTEKVGGTGKTAAELLREVTPSGMRWNGYLLRILTSGNGAEFENAKDVWGGLSEPEQQAWTDAAGQRTPPTPSATQRAEGGVSLPAASPGQVLFTLIYGIYLTGQLPAPTGTPPAFA